MENLQESEALTSLWNIVDEVVSEVRTFETGYAFMVSNTGILLSHPTRKEWIGKKSLYDFEDKEIQKAAQIFRKG